jgi:hypothetical protein
MISLLARHLLADGDCWWQPLSEALARRSARLGAAAGVLSAAAAS